MNIDQWHVYKYAHSNYLPQSLFSCNVDIFGKKGNVSGLRELCKCFICSISEKTDFFFLKNDVNDSPNSQYKPQHRKHRSRFFLFRGIYIK